MNEAEPKVEVSIPEPPAHLDAVAVEEWERISPILAKMGCLSEADRGALAGYCSKWSDWVHADTLVKKNGMFSGNTDNPESKIPMIHPAYYLAAKAHKQFMSIAVEFGLTPSSRSRIRVDKQEEEPSNLVAFDGGKK